MNHRAHRFLPHPPLVALLAFWLLAAVAAPPPATETEAWTEQIDVLLQQADAYRVSGQSRNALAALRAAQPLAESLGDPARHAVVLGRVHKIASGA